MIQQLFIVRVVFHHYWPSKLVFLMGYNYDWTYLGRQKIGEADCNDISLWCHLYWCSWPNQEEVERKMCYRRWFKTIWSSLLCSKGKWMRLWFHLCVMYNTVWTFFFCMSRLHWLPWEKCLKRQEVSWVGLASVQRFVHLVLLFIWLVLESWAHSQWIAVKLMFDLSWGDCPNENSVIRLFCYKVEVL